MLCGLRKVKAKFRGIKTTFAKRKEERESDCSMIFLVHTQRENASFLAHVQKTERGVEEIN